MARMGRQTALAVALLTLSCSLASGSLRHSPDLQLRHEAPAVSLMSAPWGCFMSLGKFGMKEAETTILFRQGKASTDGMPEVMVVQDQGGQRRTLVFQSADGQCNPQAGAICSGPQIEETSILMSNSESLTADTPSDDSEGPMDMCDTNVCKVDLVQSVTRPGSGYVRSMASALTLLTTEPERILSVGLGAGSLALVLRQAYPNSKHTVVELSKEVVDAAKCFGVSHDDFELVTADGRRYLEDASDASFDAISIDVFDNQDKVPSCFTTDEFFKTASRKLKDGGVLTMNAHSGATLHNDLRDLLPSAHAAFGSTVQLGKAPGLANIIVLATKASITAASSDNQNLDDVDGKSSSTTPPASSDAASSQKSGGSAADALAKADAAMQLLQRSEKKALQRARQEQSLDFKSWYADAGFSPDQTTIPRARSDKTAQCSFR